MKFQPKIFFLSVSICAAIAALTSYFSNLNFWVMFSIIAGTVFINGLIANWEDRRPGGFENPQLKNQEDTTKNTEK